MMTSPKKTGLRIACALGAGAWLVAGCVGGSEVDVSTEALTTFTVNSFEDLPDASPGGSGCYAPGGSCTLRAALMEAPYVGGPVEIVLQAGVYDLTIPPGGSGPDPEGASGDLDIRSDVTIRGVGMNQTRIVASNGDRVFHVETCESALFQDLSIEGGDTRERGGGLFNETLCVVRMERVRVARNRAERWGGLGNIEDGTLELLDVDVRLNRARESGGGIGSLGPVFITRSTIADNDADNGVAGVFVGGRASIRRSTISGNEADVFGRDPVGGLHVEGSAVLENVTVAENHGTPGGIWVTGFADLTHVTIGSNGVGLVSCDECGARTYVNRSIVYDADYPTCVGEVRSEGFNVDYRDDCHFHSVGDQVEVDPLLGELHADMGPTAVQSIIPGSPALDVVWDGSQVDQRGVARTGMVDAGAYELQEDVFCIDSTEDEPDDRPGDGECRSAGGRCTLRAAIMETNALPRPDSVGFCVTGVFRFGLAGADENDGATGDLDIRDDLTLHGDGPDLTILDADALDRVLDVGSDRERIGVVVSDLLVHHGQVRGYGGGANVGPLASLRMSNAVFYENATTPALLGAGSGGAIGNAGTLELESVEVLKNAATGLGALGGGILSEGLLRIRDSVLYSNWAYTSGGGIWTSGYADLARVQILSNEAAGGGGILNQRWLTVVDSTIDGNVAAERFGGGVWAPDDYSAARLAERITVLDRVTVSNDATSGPSSGAGLELYGSSSLTSSTVSGNRGRYSLVLDGTSTLTNVTIVRNEGGISGTGISIRNSILGRGSVSRDACRSPVLSLGHNLGEDATCSLSASGDIASTDPLVDWLADNGGPTWTHALMWDSRAVDAADTAFCPSVDQRGRPRLGVCDIGAYEYQ